MGSHLSMARIPPTPLFVHHGFSGGVTSCDVIDLDGQECLLVGTSKGSCAAYDAKTHQLVRKVYEDSEGRSIASVGSLEGILWLHLRNYAILFFHNECTTTTVELRHYGYCRCVTMNSALIYPDMKDDQHCLKIWSHNTPPMCIPLKNLPICLETFANLIYVGNENGVVSVYAGDELRHEVVVFKDPVFSLAISSTNVVCGSSKSPIKFFERSSITVSPTFIHYPQKSGGCSALKFSSSGKTILAGFWDGTVRAFSVRNRSVLLYLDFHSDSISNILWTEIDSEERVIITSRDEKLTLWKLK